MYASPAPGSEQNREVSRKLKELSRLYNQKRKDLDECLQRPRLEKQFAECTFHPNVKKSVRSHRLMKRASSSSKNKCSREDVGASDKTREHHKALAEKVAGNASEYESKADEVSSTAAHSDDAIVEGVYERLYRLAESRRVSQEDKLARVKAERREINMAKFHALRESSSGSAGRRYRATNAQMLASREPLYNLSRQLQREARLKEERENKESAGCTFAPTLCAKSRRMASRMSAESGQPAHERLYRSSIAKAPVVQLTLDMSSLVDEIEAQEEHHKEEEEQRQNRDGIECQGDSLNGKPETTLTINATQVEGEANEQAQGWNYLQQDDRSQGQANEEILGNPSKAEILFTKLKQNGANLEKHGRRGQPHYTKLIADEYGIFWSSKKTGQMKRMSWKDVINVVAGRRSVNARSGSTVARLKRSLSSLGRSVDEVEGENPSASSENEDLFLTLICNERDLVLSTFDKRQRDDLVLALQYGAHALQKASQQEKMKRRAREIKQKEAMEQECRRAMLREREEQKRKAEQEERARADEQEKVEKERIQAKLDELESNRKALFFDDVTLDLAQSLLKKVEKKPPSPKLSVQKSSRVERPRAVKSPSLKGHGEHNLSSKATMNERTSAFDSSGSGPDSAYEAECSSESESKRSHTQSPLAVKKKSTGICVPAPNSPPPPPPPSSPPASAGDKSSEGGRDIDGAESEISDLDSLEDYLLKHVECEYASSPRGKKVALFGE